MKAWDFAKLEPNQWQWAFPGKAPVKSDAGAVFVTDKSRPGPRMLDTAVNADDITHARVEIHAFRIEDKGKKETEVPLESAALFYTDPGAKDKSWPFGPGCRAPLLPVKGKPGFYSGSLAGRPGWEGAVKDFYISVIVPELTKEETEKGVEYRITTARIEFMKWLDSAPQSPAAQKTAAPAAPKTAPAAQKTAAPAAPKTAPAAQKTAAPAAPKTAPAEQKTSTTKTTRDAASKDR